MKLTVEDVMGEESGVKVKRPKASKEKPQRKWGRKGKDDDIHNEDDMVADEDANEVDDTELEEEEAEADGVVEDEQDDEVDEEPSKKFAALRLVALILAALIGLGLILFGIRGVIGRMQLEQTVETPTDDYDASYNEALDASEESFDDVNAAREDETSDPGAVPEGETPPEGDPNATPDSTADTTMSTAEEPSGIAVETPEHKTSLEEEIALLKAEISRLNEVVASAQNNEAMKEQELNNAKAMLEASTAREAELQRQLDALSTNNTNE